MATKKPDEGALRKKVEQTQAKVDELKARYDKDPDNKTVGRQLWNARQKAQEANIAFYEAVPDEKPPTQRVM